MKTRPNLAFAREKALALLKQSGISDPPANPAAIAQCHV